MTYPDRIIVVGAGPVGLVCAMLLCEAGIEVLVVERGDDVSDDLRASTFHPPTLDMLDPYGITAQLIDNGLIAATWQVRMLATGEFALFDLALLADETNHPYRVQCEQRNLVRFLADKVNDAGITFVFNAELTGLIQDADGVVATVKRDGDDITFPARYLVGADGANSAVREAIEMPFEGEMYPEATVLATTTFPFHDHILGLSYVNYCWTEQGGSFAMLRIPGLWRCNLYYDPAFSLEEAVSEANVQVQLNDIVPIDGAFDIVDRRPYRVHQRIAWDYRNGRVLLAGDAAHLNNPTGGMGMNGGIHDAFSLATALTSVWEGADPSTLDRYTRQRRPVAEQQIIAQSDENRRRMTETDPAKRRDELARLQQIAADPIQAKPFLLRTSMIAGLRQAAEIA